MNEKRLSIENSFKDYEKLVNEIEQEIIEVIATAGEREEQKKAALWLLQKLDKRYLEKYFPENTKDRINFHIHLKLTGKMLEKLEHIGFASPKHEDHRKIADGGLETEYIIASYSDSGVPLAVKILKNNALDQTKEMFCQEQKILSLLWLSYKDSYPKNLLQLHATGDEVTATERIIGGQPLNKKMMEDDNTIYDITGWIGDICHGLEFLYSAGLEAHNDLSPDNCVIGSDNCVVLTDFSLVAESKRPLLKTIGREAGKPRYLSPEKCIKHVDERNQPLIDKRSDIFALSIMLYQFLTKGLDPFDRGVLPHDSMLLSAFAKDIQEKKVFLLSENDRKPIPKSTVSEYAETYTYQDLTPENCPYISDQDILEKLNLFIKKCLSFDLEKRAQSPANFLQEILVLLKPVLNT